MTDGAYRLVDVVLAEPAHYSREVEMEREVALNDLMAESNFAPAGSKGGPYRLILSVEEGRLVFDIRLEDGAAHGRTVLSLTPLRRVLRDYAQICEGYSKALPDLPRERVETIDMARRGLHDDGARLLRERLKGKIAVDFDTARRLFTLIAVLRMKG